MEVIDLIFRTLTDKVDEGATSILSGNAKRGIAMYRLIFLPRLYGYELLMAPYAIAHMKIGLKLHETGYTFGSKERVRVYLTNALEPANQTGQISFADWLPALAHEARAVSSVKANQRFTVLIGNPPYSIRSGNLTEDARELVETFKFIDGTKIIEKGALQLEKNLNDDYVKFFGLLVENFFSTEPFGIACLITNHAFLDIPSCAACDGSCLIPSRRFAFWICTAIQRKRKKSRRMATTRMFLIFFSGYQLSRR